MKRNPLVIFFTLITCITSAQLKFLVDDFEGYSKGNSGLKNSGLFSYGCIGISVSDEIVGAGTYAGKKSLKIEKSDDQKFGGWGKGITWFVDLDVQTDYLNFYVFTSASASATAFRLELQDDDNEDNIYNKDQDDAWSVTRNFVASGKWELISIPLTEFKDQSPGGDGKLNLSYYTGKLLGLLISPVDPSKINKGQSWYFDFICFSKGTLPVNGTGFEPQPATASDFCTLGAWSHGEGKSANFVEIANTFEGLFDGDGNKKLGIVHFFQPFGKDDGSSGLYPSAERINKVIEAGYIPMITLENHFISAGGVRKQPNLYSITEGHFDSFFGYWCHLIKEVKGTVLLRILHEFNGDWYDWCTVKNNKNPEMVARTYRYIHNIFKQNNVTNVKFIWCPNSMSLPQEKWNYIMLAYPGDEYVDFVALDIYNGAGQNSSSWRSFRKEGIENYFVLTQKLPSKPLLICETSSRERKSGEEGQNKAEWIREMSVALKTDMSKVRLLAWFNQTDAFKVNSSKESLDAYKKYLLRDPYFKSGPDTFFKFLK